MTGREPIGTTVRGIVGSIRRLGAGLEKAYESRARKRRFEAESRKGETVVLRDVHSEHDGEIGTVTRVWEDMFGEKRYTVSFDEGEEQGVTEEVLEDPPADS